MLVRLYLRKRLEMTTEEGKKAAAGEAVQDEIEEIGGMV